MSEEKLFNPREHLMQLKSKEGDKDYLPVQWRLVWFREQCPQGSIETEVVHLDLAAEISKEVPVWNNNKRTNVLKTASGIAVFKATAKDGKGGASTGYGSESAIDFGDFIEKAETKAIGRALAALGYGTQFAPDLEEGSRIVDAPVDRAPANGSNHTNGSGESKEPIPTPEPASKELLASARQMYAKLGREVPADLNQKSALVVKRLMEQMTGQYREMLNTKNGHGSQDSGSSQVTSTESTPDVKSLRKRATALRLNWDAIVTSALKANIPDDNLTPELCARLKQFLDNIEEQRAKKPAEQKAS